MAKNLIFGPILAHLTQIWTPEFFSFIFASTRCQVVSQAIIVFNFKENSRSKRKKMTKNLILGLIQARWAQIRTVNFFYKTCSYTLIQTIILCNLKKILRKTLFWARFWSVSPKFVSPNFLLWVLSLLDVGHYRKLSLYAVSRMQ